MKRFSLFSLLLVFCFGFSFSIFACGWNCQSDRFSIEARVAYFHPSSKQVRRIYSDGWVDYQLEVATKLNCNWRLWAGVSGFSRKGESIGLHDDTKLQLIPINLGVKYMIPLDCRTQCYLGAAVCYSFLNIKDHSHFVHEHVRQGRFGGLIQLGLQYSLCEWAYMSLFADYYFQHFDFHTSHSSYSSDGYSRNSYGYVKRHDLNMNGYKIGFGWGARF